jgi:hypothetical protein
MGRTTSMPLLVIATLFLDAGAYAPALSEKHNAFVRLVNNNPTTPFYLTLCLSPLFM